jgi:hypothetical protein
MSLYLEQLSTLSWLGLLMSVAWKPLIMIPQYNRISGNPFNPIRLQTFVYCWVLHQAQFCTHIVFIVFMFQLINFMVFSYLMFWNLTHHILGTSLVSVFTLYFSETKWYYIITTLILHVACTVYRAPCRNQLIKTTLQCTAI